MQEYYIKANERLFEQWMALEAKTNTVIQGNIVLQNDITLTSEDLNDWYKLITFEIQETEKDFERIINDLYKLRDKTVNYIKNCSEDPFN